MGMMLFHLAIPINDIARAKDFYVTGLGCGLGRANDQALILNLGGHQLVAHMTREPLVRQGGIYPRHFGLVFSDEADWDCYRQRAEAHQLTFRDRPRRRFSDRLTEHQTFFLEDPFYNLLEFKVYRHPEAIFGGQEITEIGDR